MVDRGPLMVGVDFSNAARYASQHAALWAARLGVELVVAHAWNPRAWEGMNASLASRFDELVDAARDLAREELDTWVSSLEMGVESLRREIEDGPASRVLPDLALRLGAELLVVGRHGHASLAHVFLGSVSERVIRGAPCPVLLVPQLGGAPELPRRFLVGVDFSDGSARAVRTAIDFADRLGCEGSIVCVHALQPARAAELDESARRTRLETTEVRFEAWLEGLGVATRPIERRIEEGHPEHLLQFVAREAGCECIVLGVRGAGHPESPLVGSTTQRIMKLASRCVLIAPDGEGGTSLDSGA